MEWGLSERDTKKLRADTSIRGKIRGYPPLISVIMNMAVRGACITPAMSPAMATSTKCTDGTSMPNCSSNRT